MKRLIAIALPALCAAIAWGLPLRFAADAESPRTRQAAAYRGETLEIEARLEWRGAPLAVAAGAEASMLWQTNGMEDAWWEAPAAVTTGGVVRATWSPSNDVGAAAYRVFLRVADGGANYRANMLLRMLGSPGAAPNALPLPVRRIDFAEVSITNAPWIESESDPTVPAWAKADAPPVQADTNIEVTVSGFISNPGDPLDSVIWRAGERIYEAGEAAANAQNDAETGIYLGEVSLKTLAPGYDSAPDPPEVGDYLYDLEVKYWTGSAWVRADETTGATISDSLRRLRHDNAATALAATNYTDMALAAYAATNTPTTVSNVVTKAYVEDLGISGGGGVQPTNIPPVVATATVGDLSDKINEILEALADEAN